MTMYAKDDIRSQLSAPPAAAAAPVDPSTPIKPAQYFELHDLEPDEVSALGSRTWITRGQNWVLVWTDAVAGDVLTRTGQPDEYVALLYSESAGIRVTAGTASEEVTDEAFVVIPPGDSSIEILTDGPLIRLISTLEPGLASSARNADAYAVPDARCAPLVPWPDPVGGFALRVHHLADTPIVEGRFGRIFRTTNFMVNFLAEEPAPRDPLKLSPHFHDDFEQLSVSVKGNYVHHIRYPWGPDSTQWRDDEHGHVDTPSLTIIPPPTVHTSQGLGPHQQLLDIFSPPRDDFSAQPGWVLNASEYPSK
ncbi:MAG: hypothetical protein JWR01_19 [Subtercola sp.]|nr:hypothetical protein [Subtercola sp.]